jgi:hypothetical protein
MNILYQYYNEVVLAFRDYYVDFVDGKIVIEVPASTKPFDIVCGKIADQLSAIAGQLEPRDRDIEFVIKRDEELKEFVLAKEE